MSGRLADYLVRGNEADLPDAATAAAAPNADILRFFRADDTGNLFVLDRNIPAWVQVNVPPEGLGNAATRDVGTSAGTVAAGDDARLTGAAQKAANLSDVGSPSAARGNLGLGSAATKNLGTGGDAVPLFTNATNNWSGGHSTPGPLTVVSSVGQATFQFASPSGYSCNFDFRNTTGGARWRLQKSDTAESGSNSGADLLLFRFQDNGGGFPGAPLMTITRATGDMAYNGLIRPAVDNSFSLGSGTFRFSVVYAGTGSINTSDERAKQEIQAVPESLLDAWGAVEWCKFRFRDAFEAKGPEARWHFGTIAQRVRDAVDAVEGEGSALRLGLICQDSWEAEDEVTQPIWAERETGEQDAEGLPLMETYDTGEVAVLRPALAAGDRWGLRYDECFALEAAYQRRRMDRIEARLAALGA